jgi:hypothetical protein
MPSAVYIVFEQAMRAKQRVVCLYKGHLRVLCPVVLGHTRGEERALTYQCGGDSSSGLPPAGEWRCLSLERVAGAHLQDGDWIVGGESHTWPQGRVEEVDLDVNSESLYSPKRRL